jgi:C-terminal processing protease CtpA/Prc
LLLLTSCGGGGNSSSSSSLTSPTPAPAACSLAAEKNWLRAHIRDKYLWASITPDLPPGGDEQSLEDYFRSLLFAGNDLIPKDRYSGYSSSASFSQYYDEGTELGYGLAVRGLEIFGQPNEPLRIRYVEPKSPAALAGLRRGDEVLWINDRSAAERLLAEDFDDLVPKQAGDVLRLRLQRDGQPLSVELTASTYDLTQVQQVSVLETPLGKRVGYLYLHSFTNQAKVDLQQAFTSFAQQGIREAVIDLRYNPGGLVSVSQHLASLLAGQRFDNQTYVRLAHNPNNTSLDQTYRFSDPIQWTGLHRVYVLTGQRSCSASEQLVSGLRGAGIEVITVGGTTCGKPVGSTPTSYCSTVYSVISFQSLNALGEGGYFDGITPNCPVVDDATRAFDDPKEALIQTALAYVDSGRCPVGLASARFLSGKPPRQLPTLPSRPHSLH